MGQNPDWWQDPSLRAAADALAYVSTDLLERMNFPEHLSEESLERIEESLQSVGHARQATFERLVGAADRFAAAGDLDRAIALDTQADALRSDRPIAIFEPDLGRLQSNACTLRCPTSGARSAGSATNSGETG